MKLWFQIVLCVGIVSVSAASLSYAWQIWRAYQLELRAEEICKVYLDDKFHNFPNVGDIEKWFTRRQCVNGVLEKGELTK